MQLYCPTCKLSMRPAERCPHCAGRLITPAELEQFGSLRASSLVHFSQLPRQRQLPVSAAGRVLVGVLAGLGAYVGLREACLGWLMLTWPAIISEPQQVAILDGILRGLTMFLAGLLAGAGRQQPALLGGVAGGICTVAFFALEAFQLQKLPQTELGLYLGTALLAFPAGWAGGQLWQIDEPLPELPRRSRGSSVRVPDDFLKPPVPTASWSRGRLGLSAVLWVVMWLGSEPLRLLLKHYLGHTLYMGSPAEGYIVTAFLACLGMTLAGIMAGAGTGSGCKHGLAFAGLVSLLLVLLLFLRGDAMEPAAKGMLNLLGVAENPTHPRGLVWLLGMVSGHGLVCAAFGNLLFPKIRPVRRCRRFDD